MLPELSRHNSYINWFWLECCTVPGHGYRNPEEIAYLGTRLIKQRGYGQVRVVLPCERDRTGNNLPGLAICPAGCHGFCPGRSCVIIDRVCNVGNKCAGNELQACKPVAVGLYRYRRAPGYKI